MDRAAWIACGIGLALCIACEKESPPFTGMDSGMDSGGPDGGGDDSGNDDSGNDDSGNNDGGSIDSGHAGSCLADGVRHDQGTEWFDGCNWCECSDSGGWCTARFCPDGAVDEACVLPVDPGNCLDTGVERFYYDAMSNTCQPFDAFCGGAGGNSNNFASRAECWQHCGFDNW